MLSTCYGAWVEVKIGIFITPDAGVDVLAQIRAADESGLDAIAVQDHPYQPRFHDMWTLLAYAGAVTRRVRLVADVVNLPLRPPAVLAKGAATLDRLTGGRVELGIGAGAFWDAIAAVGGPRRTPGESVDALEEAIGVLRAWWSGERSVSLVGDHYGLHGAHPGPAPAHPIGLWIGARRPRMLGMTGRLGDGWLPSWGPDRFAGDDELRSMWSVVADAARDAGRDPDALTRALNVMEPPACDSASTLAHLAGDLGFTTLLIGVPADDGVAFVRRLGEDVAPRARQLLG